ncbi:hypothetical protein WMF37_18395 [Sorangium sp. So ce291]|uniref:hypothetical protein n=1 Tax=Sorangium sp. So ce291 TaxID=3133294 RepID=UPI003F61EE27
MTLLERCRTLRGRIERHERLKSADKAAEKFRERSQEVSAACKELSSALAKMAVLRSGEATLGPKEVEPLRRLPDPKKALASLANLREKLDTNPGSFNDGKEYTSFKRAFEKVAGDAAAVVENVIKEIESGIPSVDEVFLKQVERIPSYKARVSEIRAKRDELSRGVDLGAATSAQIEQFLERRATLRALTDKLDPKEFPKAVLEFYKAARQASGAPLRCLTEEVRTWLEECGQLGHVRLIIVD